MKWKRLTFSAAIIGAISYPIYDGKWSAFPDAFSAFDNARWREAENKYFDSAGTTRSEFMIKTFEKCEQLDRAGSFTHSSGKDGYNPMFPPEGAHDSDMRACLRPAIVSSQNDSVRSYYEGSAAAIKELSPWLLDAILGAMLAGLIALFGPHVIGGYSRWVRAE